MKKIFFISASLTVLLLMMFLTGIIDYKNIGREALIKGNRYYTAGDYVQALKAYREGLEKKPGDLLLNYNSGQASYRLKDYQKAIEYYNKAPARVDKHLNSGNSSLRLGDAGSDTNQKLQYYQQALEAYKQGILEFPQNVALKYNYEYAKSKFEQLQNEDQQNSEENNDQQEEPQEEQQEDQQGEQQQEDQQEEQQEDQSQDNKQDENGQDNQQNEPASQSEQNDEQNEDGNEDQNSSSLSESDSSQSEQEGNDAQVQQVLEMLEKQEEYSLKNNQEMINDGKEEEHDW